MKKILIVLVFLAGMAAFTAGMHQVDNKDASVGQGCSFYNYSNPTRVFVTCPAGNYAAKFKARIVCSDQHAYDGAWQTQPGPWAGSTATCPSGLSKLNAFAIFG